MPSENFFVPRFRVVKMPKRSAEVLKVCTHDCLVPDGSVTGVMTLFQSMVRCTIKLGIVTMVWLEKSYTLCIPDSRIKGPRIGDVSISRRIW